MIIFLSYCDQQQENMLQKKHKKAKRPVYMYFSQLLMNTILIRYSVHSTPNSGKIRILQQYLPHIDVEID